MRILTAAVAALAALACSNREEREPAAPPSSSAPAPEKIEQPAPAAADAGAALAPELALTLTADGKALLGGKEVEAAKLAAELEKATAHAEALVIVADEKVPHGRVVEVMEMAKKAGFTKIAIGTDVPR